MGIRLGSDLPATGPTYSIDYRPIYFYLVPIYKHFNIAIHIILYKILIYKLYCYNKYYSFTINLFLLYQVLTKLRDKVKMFRVIHVLYHKLVGTLQL